MDKTEKFAEAIYQTLEKTQAEIVRDLSSDNKFQDERYEFIRKLYQSLNNHEKGLFSRYIKGIFSDNIATILADFDGITSTDAFPCECIRITCDSEELKPWMSELFIAIFQEKNPDME